MSQRIFIAALTLLSLTVTIDILPLAVDPATWPSPPQVPGILIALGFLLCSVAAVLTVISVLPKRAITGIFREAGGSPHNIDE